MSQVAIKQRVLSLLGELLSYPRAGVGQTASEAAALIRPDQAEAAALLSAFAAAVQQATLGEIEESYTRLFELNAACHPYAGYHLFGESYKRSVFLLELKKLFKAQDFECGSELPDHVAVLLHFVALSPESSGANDIMGEALLPTLERMMGTDTDPLADDSEAGRRPLNAAYLHVLQAAHLILQMYTPAAAAPGVGAAALPAG